MTYKELWKNLRERISPKGSRDFGSPCIPWEQHERDARATADIDYGCNFKRGLCKVQQSQLRASLNYPTYPPSVNPAGCCQGCATNIGYLVSIKPGTLMTYIRSWHPQWGFWEAGTGCKLPRELRSQTCLNYHCSHTVELVHGKWINPVQRQISQLFRIKGVKCTP